MNIRSAEPADAGRLLGIYAYYVENTAVTFEYDIPTEKEFGERIRSTLEKYPFLVLEDGGETVGYAYAGVFKDRAAYSRSCEISIYLDHDKRRRGFGSALYRALEEKLAERGIINVYACIASPLKEDEYLSRDSERFHGALGFVKVGEFHKCGYKFGRWYDMIWMEKFIGPHD